MFRSPRPADLITVPACRQCNQGFSIEDEYFRIAILGPARFMIQEQGGLGRAISRGLATLFLKGKQHSRLSFEESLRESEAGS